MGDENNDAVIIDQPDAPIPTIAENNVQFVFPENMIGILNILNKANLFTFDIWNTFIEHEIDDDGLKNMNATHLATVLPKLGHQVRFETERAKWLKNTKEYVKNCGQEKETIEQEDPFQETAKNLEDELFDLESILCEFNKPKRMYNLYMQETKSFQGVPRPLFRKERKIVSNTIMDWVVEKGILLRRGDFLKVFEKIRDIFPRETSGLYYMPPNKMEKERKDSESSSEESSKNESVSVKKGHSSENNSYESDENPVPTLLPKPQRIKKVKNTVPSGLLYSSYRYRLEKKRRELAESGLSSRNYYRNLRRAVVDGSPDTELHHITTDEGLANIKEWLIHNYEPWDTVKSKWRQSCALRLIDMNNKEFSFDQILAMWPRYTKQTGYELIDIDFTHLFPESASNLKYLWSTYSKKIIDCALNHAKEQKHKDKIDQFKMKESFIDTENNYIGCLALHAIFYMCPSKNGYINQNITSMFRKANKGTLINEEVHRISEEISKLKTKKTKKMNPFIIYYEDKNNVPYKFFVCINHLIYEIGNFITALDTLFKSYFVFKFQYPDECINTLIFIQQFFFKIFYSKDFKSYIMNSFMCEIDPIRGAEVLER